MGLLISNVFSHIFGKKEIRVLMVGLGAAGKTTILYKLKLGQVVTSIATIGFNVEIVKHKNIQFTVWDVAGGSDKLRPLWYHYYHNSRAVIFVVDSSDRESIDEAGHSLNGLLDHAELNDAPLLVLANKQDLPNAMTTDEVAQKLKLPQMGDRHWYVHPTCAIQGEGLYEALDWLANELS